MISRRSLYLLVGIIVLVLMMTFGCSEDPSEVGIGLLAPEDTLHVASQEILATRDTTFLRRITGNSGTIFVGKHDDVEAASIMEFASVPAFAAGAQIDSAVISFVVNYAFQDSNGLFAFDAHSMIRTWSETNFTWDSLANSYGLSTAGSFSRTVSPLDTIIQLRLDTALIRTWSQAGSGSIALTAVSNNPAMNLILGFSNILLTTGDSRPLLTVSYHDSADTTITFQLRTSRAIYVANSAIVPPPQSITLQAGVSSRGIIKFDSLSLPPKVSITQATLRITIDQASSIVNHFTRDSLLVYLSRKDVLPFDSLILGTVCTLIDSGSEKIFVADVKNIVQQWITREPNNGFVIQSYGEFTRLDRFVLHGAGAAAAVRPKLQITYTVFP